MSARRSSFPRSAPAARRRPSLPRPLRGSSAALRRASSHRSPRIGERELTHTCIRKSAAVLSGIICYPLSYQLRHILFSIFHETLSFRLIPKMRQNYYTLLLYTICPIISTAFCINFHSSFYSIKTKRTNHFASGDLIHRKKRGHKLSKKQRTADLIFSDLRNILPFIGCYFCSFFLGKKLKPPKQTVQRILVGAEGFEPSE